MRKGEWTSSLQAMKCDGPSVHRFFFDSYQKSLLPFIPPQEAQEGERKGSLKVFLREVENGLFLYYSFSSGMKTIMIIEEGF